MGIGSVCCFLYLFYALIYAPLTNAVLVKTQQLTEKKDTLVWMQSMRQQHKMNKTPAVLSHGQLLSVLAKQLSSASFHAFPYQLQQTGAGDIQLSFEQVPYNAFVLWLWSLHEQYAFSIKQCNVDHTDTLGVVKVGVLIY